MWIELEAQRDGSLHAAWVADRARQHLGSHARCVVPSGTGVLVELDPHCSPGDRILDLLDTIPLVDVTDHGRDWLPRVHTIPVCYDTRVAMDLRRVADTCGLNENELIEVHQRIEYFVETVGFSPGFGYLGSVDERIRLPRRGSPRARVPAGSVAIAERMTAVYPSPSAGGWHLIGRTRSVMFDPARNPACVLRAGDRVRFRSISYESFMESEHSI